MFCKNCGSPMEAGALFCNTCGARVEPQAPVQPDYDATVGVGFMPPRQPQPMPQPQQWSYPPQQPMQQPPVYQPPQPQPWSYVAEQPVKEKKPINKRKLIGTIAASLLILALVGGLLAYFTIFNTPEYKVYSAAKNTIEEFETVLGKGKPVFTAAKNIMTMLEESEMSIDLSVDGYDVSFDYSKDDEILRAAAEIRGTEFIIAADDEKLAISIPDYLSNAYSIPLEDFGKKLCEWDVLSGQIPSDVRKQLENLSIDLFGDSSWEEFQGTDAYKEFEDSLFFDEVEETIPNAKCDTVYCISVEAADVMDMLIAYVEFVLEPIMGDELYSSFSATSLNTLKKEMRSEFKGITVIILVGINEDDCITALRASYEKYGEEDESIAVVLAGEDNIWERIECYENDDLDTVIRFETTSSGFDVYADYYYHDYYYDYESDSYIIDSEPILSYTDYLMCGDGKYLTFAPDSRYSVTIAYSVDGDDCGFSFDADGIPVEINMSPDVDAKMISGKIVDIFSLDMDDLEDLAEEFEDLEYLFD